MTTIDFDGNYAISNDYDILIESEYYNRDYDEVDSEESFNGELNAQTDILFE